MNRCYAVAYEGQIITVPLPLREAAAIAYDENVDAMRCGHLPLAEVVLPLRECRKQTPKQQWGKEK